MTGKKMKRAPDQDQRDLILEKLDVNMLVEAAAGTGKTTSMVGRMVALLRTGTCGDIRAMAAVTFTRKAAAELRGRFHQALERAAGEAKGEERDRLADALGRVEQCYVGTIHSFCARLLRERPIEAGADIGFSELEEDEDIRLRGRAWNDFRVSLLVSDPDGLLDDARELGLDLAKLESAFVEYAKYPDVDEWPIPALASAGISLDGARQRLRDYLAHMEELQPLLPGEWGNDKLIPQYLNLPRIASHYDLEIPAQLMEMFEHFTKKPNFVQTPWKDTGNFDADGCKAENALWHKFREEVALPMQKLWLERRYGPIMKLMAGARRIYDRLRSERGELNYQDLLLLSARLLRQGTHVREYFARRFTHLLVDEFHDTDPVQAEVMLLLTATDPGENDWRRCKPRPGSLFVVGDPKQSIYRFRRADIVTYNEVKRIIAASGLTVRLSANFRSAAGIIEWVNRTFGPADGEEDDGGSDLLRFEAEDSEESPAYVPLLAGSDGKAAGPLSGMYRLAIPGDLNQVEAVPWEADHIAGTIRRQVDEGASPGDFMIVTYNTKKISEYGKALQNFGLPHQVTGGKALNLVGELRLFLTCLRAVSRPDDQVALVGALRSELFGVSDAALYAFKKAGGRFSLHATVPEDLDERHAGPLSLALERLSEYRGWLTGLPRMAAFEKILSDLGLPARAATRTGGEVEAGSLAKSLELLRSVDREAWTASQTIDRLQALVDVAEKHDGVSALPEERSVVRVMNLHKVKGLEAPVVFLACPYGRTYWDPSICVDRSGEKTVGHMAISVKVYDNNYKDVALPAGWKDLSAREVLFGRAEKLRLRYVAATRAGRAMVITTFAGKDKWNPWWCFEPLLDDARELPDPGEQHAPKRKLVSLEKREVSERLAQIAERTGSLARPTYGLSAAKALALSGRKSAEAPDAAEEPRVAEPVSEGEHGAQWGSVIHRLLEVAMEGSGVDLRSLAGALLEEHEIDPSHLDAALSTVESVMESDIWKRAMKSDRRFSEAPFQILVNDEETGLPTVVRGAIDLVFEEDGAWVVVDYKTDVLAGRTPQDIADRYAPQVKLYADAWERCTGGKVKETAVLLVRSGETVVKESEL